MLTFGDKLCDCTQTHTFTLCRMSAAQAINDKICIPRIMEPTLFHPVSGEILLKFLSLNLILPPLIHPLLPFHPPLPHPGAPVWQLVTPQSSPHHKKKNPQHKFPLCSHLMTWPSAFSLIFYYFQTGETKNIIGFAGQANNRWGSKAPIHCRQHCVNLMLQLLVTHQVKAGINTVCSCSY